MDDIEMAHIRDTIDKSLKSDRQSVIITLAIIKQCISRLKSGKDDGDLGFKSEHVINGSHRLHVVLSLLFNIIVNHGYTPDVLLKSTIVSIPKDPKVSLSNSENYRGMSLFNLRYHTIKISFYFGLCTFRYHKRLKIGIYFKYR